MKRVLLGLAFAASLHAAAPPLMEHDFTKAFPKVIGKKGVEYQAISRQHDEKLVLYATYPSKYIKYGAAYGVTCCALAPIIKTQLSTSFFAPCFLLGTGIWSLVMTHRWYKAGKQKNKLLTFDKVGIQTNNTYVLRWNELHAVTSEQFFHDQLMIHVDETSRYYNKLGVELWSYTRPKSLPVSFHEFTKITEYFVNKYKKAE